MSEPSEPPAGSRVSASHSWWTLSVVLAVALAALIAIVSNSGVLSIDLDVARRIQEIDSPGWVAFLNFGEGLTNLRGGGLLGCAVLTAGFWFRGLPAATVTIVIAPAIWVPKQLIEDFVARPRPTVDLVEITQTAEGFSFPSGHVTAGVAVYGMLAIIAILSFRPRWAKVATVCLVAAILASSALSRVAFGAHWPTDVLGALLLGALWLSGLTWFYRWLEQSGLANYLPLARRRRAIDED